MQVKNRIIAISGGASGLGEACARLFVESGAKVGIFDLNEEAGGKLLRDLGRSAIFCRTDVCSEQSVKESIDATVEAFGAVHVLVNCAGVANAAKIHSKKGSFPMQVFNKVVQINLMGTMHMICSGVQAMMKNEPDNNGERGVIINCSSGAAFYGQVGQAAYSASKAAVVGMTLPIAREIGDYGMRIVSIAPGLFETPLTSGVSDAIKQGIVAQIPFPKRLGYPMEFALLARHIVENPYINGTTINLDGAAILPSK